MALPVEIAEFFSIIADFWLLIPLPIRQVYYLALSIVAVFIIVKFYRGGSDD